LRITRKYYWYITRIIKLYVFYTTFPKNKYRKYSKISHRNNKKRKKKFYTQTHTHTQIE